MRLLATLARTDALAFPGWLGVVPGVFATVFGAAIVVVTGALATIFVVRETRSDRRGGASLQSALATKIGGAIGLGAIALVIGGVAWLAFGTVASRLPFAAPAPGGPEATPYLVAAVLLHGIVGYVALWIVVSAWSTLLGMVSESRLFSLSVLFTNVVAVVGWEAQHLPVWFLVGGELFLVILSGDSLVKLVFAPSTRNSVLRAQNLVAIVFAALGIVAIWMTHHLPPLTVSLGPLTRAAHPTIYLLMLIVLAVSVALVCANCLLQPQPTFTTWFGPNNPGPQRLLPFLMFVVALVYLLWLSLTVAPLSLPFAAPSAGSVWLGVLPAAATYAALGGILHGLSAYILIQSILAFGLFLLGWYSDTRWNALGVLVGIVLTSLVWETLGWPVTILVPGEAILVYIANIQLGWLWEAVLKPLMFKQPLTLRRIKRSLAVCSALLMIAAIGYILFAHSIGYAPIDLFLLYLALVLLDTVAANVGSVIRPQNSATMLLSPRRWQITLPIALVVITLGASGFFAPVEANSGLTFTVWIEEGMAAATYLLFKPLIDLASDVGGKRATQPGSDEVLDLSRRVIEFLSGPNYFAQRVANRSADAPVEPTPGELFNIKRDRAALEAAEKKVATELSFPTGRIFFISLLVFHFLITMFNITPILNSSLVPLVFGLVGLVATLLPLVTDKVLEPTRYIALLLLLVTTVVTGLNVILTVAPPSPTPSVFLGQSALALLTSGPFYAVALHIGLQEALILLTVGQLGYLYVVINLNIMLEQEGAKEPDADGWHELAADLFDKGRMDEALVAYVKAIECDPENPRLLHRQARIYAKLNRDLDALAIYESLTTRDKNDEMAWYSRGIELFVLTRYDEALAAFEKAIALAPNDYYDWENKGQALLQLDRNDEALVAFDRAIALDAKQVSPLNGKGRALLNLNRVDEALAAFQQANTLAPDNAVYWANTGLTLYRLGRHEEELAAFERSAKLAPENAGYLVNIGNTLTSLNRDEEALATFERATVLDPKLVSAWIHAGETLTRLQRYAEAHEAFGKSLALDATNVPALVDDGFALWHADRNDEAIVAFDQALALDCANRDAIHGKGLSLSAAQRQTEALALYDAALLNTPDVGLFWRDKGEALSDLKRDEEALAAYDHALTLAPEDTITVDLRAKLLQRMGRAPEASGAAPTAVVAVAPTRDPQAQ